jgi:Zn-dependent peptidase ImmA (M78 family)
VTEAARAVSVTQVELQALETGEKNASASILRKLSDAYAIPISRFYADASEELAPPLPDFRTVKNKEAEYTSYLVRGIAWADEIAKFAKFLTASSPSPPPKLPYIVPNNIFDAARELERTLAFGANFRSSKLSANQLLRHLKKELGNFGILVLQDSINDQTCRGFCFADEYRAPTIVINTRNQGTYEARLFTLVHEACHVFSRREGIIDPFSETNEFERYCNAVTAEFLAPSSEFVPYVSERLESGTTPGNSDVKRIASHFRLSQQATALRLEQLGLARKGFYQTWIKRFEGLPFPDQTSAGGGAERPDEGVIKLAKYGHYFIQLCATAIREKRISELDVFNVSRLKPQYFGQTVKAAEAFIAEVESYGQR